MNSSNPLQDALIYLNSSLPSEEVDLFPSISVDQLVDIARDRNLTRRLKEILDRRNSALVDTDNLLDLLNIEITDLQNTHKKVDYLFNERRDSRKIVAKASFRGSAVLLGVSISFMLGPLPVLLGGVLTAMSMVSAGVLTAHGLGKLQRGDSIEIDQREFLISLEENIAWLETLKDSLLRYKER